MRQRMTAEKLFAFVGKPKWCPAAKEWWFELNGGSILLSGADLSLVTSMLALKNARSRGKVSKRKVAV